MFYVNGTKSSDVKLHVRGKSCTHRDMICWPCGCRLHIRRRRFRLMWQCRRQRRQVVMDLIGVGVDVAYETIMNEMSCLLLQLLLIFLCLWPCELG